MRDRLPTPGKENRVKITQDDGTAVEGVLSYADDATQEGSPYTKGNVLPDEVCNAYGLDTDTAEPKDAFLAVPGIMGKALISITVYKINGTPYPGVVIGGLTGIDTPRRTTNSNGNVTLYVDAGTYNLTFTPNPVCVNSTIPNKQVVVAAGGSASVTTTEVTNGVTTLNITSSRSVAFCANTQNLDVFCVGGGGGGATTAGYCEAGGGGGGYTEMEESVSFAPYTSYTAYIGSGGSANSNGGTTSILGVNAQGGKHGEKDSYPTPGQGYYAGSGGDGGSGGGGGGDDRGGAGGSDGGNGGRGYDADNNPKREADGGQGQGTTTRAWGDPSGTLYAGGGGGAGYYSADAGSGGGGEGAQANSPATNGEPNTGGGGGGGKSVSGQEAGGSGGSGIILLRWVNAS